MRNYLVIITLFLGNITQAQIMLPAYQSIQYRSNILPVITTNAITSISTTSAVSGGNITSDGGAAVTVRGICWDITSGPTIALATKTIDGSGIGNFTSTLTGLTIGTTYYVRAYATNGVGTAYGNEVTYIAVFPNCGTVNIDYNSFNGEATVTIGSQCWSQKNFSIPYYRDNTPLQQVNNPADLANLTVGAWCYYEGNGNNQYEPEYGRLYNWYAVAGIYDAASLANPSLRKQLAPLGWHVATYNEWTTLTTFLGGANVAGGKLKEAGTIHWLSPNTGTNSSGFTARGGGLGGNTLYGTWNLPTYNGFWWTSTEINTTNARGIFMVNSDDKVYFSIDNKSAAYYVRIIKD